MDGSKAITGSDTWDQVREKLNEYLTMLAPVQRAEKDLALTQMMLKERTSDEIHVIAPVLGALAESLNVSTVDMLLAEDRVDFVQKAVERSGLSVDEISRRLIESSATASDDLKLLGFGESL